MEEQNKNKKISDYEYSLLTTATLIVLGIGTLFYHFIEKLKFLDALYLSVVTLATVGYGDITPKTDLGKIFTIFYIIIGIGILAAFANAIIKRAAQKHRDRLNN